MRPSTGNYMPCYMIDDSGGDSYIVIAESEQVAQLTVAHAIRVIGLKDLNGNFPAEVTSCRQMQASRSVPNAFILEGEETLMLIMAAGGVT